MMNRALKTIGAAGAVVVAVAHIGVLGHLVKTNEKIALRPQQPQINIPNGKYSSYEIIVDKDGYRIKYRADDPKVLTSERGKQYDNTKKGWFGGGTSKGSEWRRDEYTSDGYRNTQGGAPVEEGKLTAKQLECIKAQGGAESQGVMAGTAITSGLLTPALINIPYIGWLAAGWANLLGQRVGGSIGQEIGSVFNDCDN